jgi:hypothetical protein
MSAILYNVRTKKLYENEKFFRGASKTTFFQVIFKRYYRKKPHSGSKSLTHPFSPKLID